MMSDIAPEPEVVEDGKDQKPKPRPQLRDAGNEELLRRLIERGKAD